MRGWRCLLVACAAAPAYAEIHVHTEKNSGVTIISNVRDARAQASAAASTKAAAPVRTVSAPAVAANMAGPAQFPRVTKDEQRERDGGRRAILLEELDAEQRALDAASARQAPADVLRRHYGNIAALQRELRR